MNSDYKRVTPEQGLMCHRVADQQPQQGLRQRRRWRRRLDLSWHSGADRTFSNHEARDARRSCRVLAAFSMLSVGNRIKQNRFLNLSVLVCKANIVPISLAHASNPAPNTGLATHPNWMHGKMQTLYRAEQNVPGIAMG